MKKLTLVLCAFSMLAVSSVSYNIIKKGSFQSVEIKPGG